MRQEHPEWGSKHVCSECETRFYDLMRAPPTCPKCGTAFIAAIRSQGIARANPKVRSPVRLRRAQARELGEAKPYGEDAIPDDREGETADDADDEEDEDSEDEDR